MVCDPTQRNNGCPLAPGADRRGDEGLRRGRAITSMKRDWKVIFPFEK
jgi:hypothetical protein